MVSWLNDAFTLLERHPGRAITGVGLLFAAVYVSIHMVFPRDHGRIVNGDAIQYYAYLRSMAVDGDLDFTNDYRLLYRAPEAEAADQVEIAQVTDSPPANYFSVGPAIFWAPLFLLVTSTVWMLRLFGLEVPMDGVAPPFQLAAGVAGIVYVTAGVYLSFDVCRRVYSSAVAFWATVVAWLGTSAVYYSLVSPAYSHAVSLFAVALFCHTWLRTRGQDSLGRFVVLGSLGGLAALVRWQDVIVLGLPLVELSWQMLKRQRSVERTALQAAIMVPAVFVVLVPQMLAWRAIYGQYILVPQGSGFMHWTDPAVVSVLFSLNHGLFTWTPVVLVAVMGFWSLTRRDFVLGWSTILILAMAVFINASVSDWWAGEAFGARRFVGYTVFFSLGIAGFASGLTWTGAPRRRWVAVALVAYNLLFLLQYSGVHEGLRSSGSVPRNGTGGPV